jgi:hypothetical protein
MKPMTHFMKQFRAALFLPAVLVFAGMSSLALAANYKTWPGAICNSVNYNTAFSYTTLGFLQSSVVAGSYDFICPLERDTVVETGGISKWEARVYDGDSTHNITCDFYSRSADGTFQERASQTSSGTGYQTLSTLDIGVSADWGYHNSICTLPEGSFIYSFYLSELDE